MGPDDRSEDCPRSEECELDGVVRSIADHARTVNLERAAGLSRAVEQVASGRPPDQGWDAAADLAHQLVGSAGTFGFVGVSDLASELESFFASADVDPPRVALARAQIRSLVAQLSAAPDS